MSINDTGPKIKLYYILLIALVAISSFGLGRLSKKAQNDGQVSITYPAGNQAANAVQSAPKASLPVQEGANSFVASSKGSKYYPIDCSAADSLKEGNKVYFNTEAEAQSAGYTRSTSCK